MFGACIDGFFFVLLRTASARRTWNASEPSRRGHHGSRTERSPDRPQYSTAVVQLRDARRRAPRGSRASTRIRASSTMNSASFGSCTTGNLATLINFGAHPGIILTTLGLERLRDRVLAIGVEDVASTRDQTAWKRGSAARRVCARRSSVANRDRIDRANGARARPGPGPFHGDRHVGVRTAASYRARRREKPRLHDDDARCIFRSRSSADPRRLTYLGSAVPATVGGDALHRDVSSPSPSSPRPNTRVHPRVVFIRGVRAGAGSVLAISSNHSADGRRPHREHRRVHARAPGRARRTAVRTRADDGGASTPSRRRVPHETHHGVQAVAVVHRRRASFADGQREHRWREVRASRRGVRGGRGWRGRLRVVDDRRGSTRRRVVEPDASNRAATRVGKTRDRVGGSRERGGGGGAEERWTGSVGDEDGVGRGLDGVRAVGSRGAADGGVGVVGRRTCVSGWHRPRRGRGSCRIARCRGRAPVGEAAGSRPASRRWPWRATVTRANHSFADALHVGPPPAARLRTPIRRPDHLRRVRSATGHGLRANTCQTRAIADCPPPGVSPSGKLGSSEETLIARDHRYAVIRNRGIPFPGSALSSWSDRTTVREPRKRRLKNGGKRRARPSPRTHHGGTIGGFMWRGTCTRALLGVSRCSCLAFSTSSNGPFERVATSRSARS